MAMVALLRDWPALGSQLRKPTGKRGTSLAFASFRGSAACANMLGTVAEPGPPGDLCVTVTTCSHAGVLGAAAHSPWRGPLPHLRPPHRLLHARSLLAERSRSPAPPTCCQLSTSPRDQRGVWARAPRAETLPVPPSAVSVRPNHH